MGLPGEPWASRCREEPTKLFLRASIPVKVRYQALLESHVTQAQLLHSVMGARWKSERRECLLCGVGKEDGKSHRFCRMSRISPRGEGSELTDQALMHLKPKVFPPRGIAHPSDRFPSGPPQPPCRANHFQRSLWRKAKC